MNVKPANSNESPKTPGGISKSLLTPCRRVGLSRKWKHSGPSPFISPLNTNKSGAVTPTEENIHSNKRKQLRPVGEATESDGLKAKNNELRVDENDGINKTPTRQVALPRRKKSKIFTSNIDIEDESTPKDTQLIISNTLNSPENECNKLKIRNTIGKDIESFAVNEPRNNKHQSINIESDEEISKSVENIDTLESNIQLTDKIEQINTPTVSNSTFKVQEKSPKKRSPKDLTTECMVVIEKRLFKKNINTIPSQSYAPNAPTLSQSVDNLISPQLFDLDSDETVNHISKLKKKADLKSVVDFDDDFVDNTLNIKNKIKKLEEKKNSVELKSQNVKKRKHAAKSKDTVTQNSDISCEDEDDLFADNKNKKTILIKKSYAKVAKLSRAKSTGSITQKDVEELKARIAMKKDLLLAKNMSQDIKEVRDLIKKWRKGCQEALTELMDLMKKNYPDKHNMDISELLEMLKIPSDLVGYNADHDCFESPEQVTLFDY